MNRFCNKYVSCNVIEIAWLSFSSHKFWYHHFWQSGKKRNNRLFRLINLLRWYLWPYAHNTEHHFISRGKKMDLRPNLYFCVFKWKIYDILQLIFRIITILIHPTFERHFKCLIFKFYNVIFLTSDIDNHHNKFQNFT